MTRNQKAILAAIEAGHTTIRAIAQHTGHSSATIHSNVRKLEKGGHLILHQNGKHTTIDTGAEYAAGWDMAARLAGNPDA